MHVNITTVSDRINADSSETDYDSIVSILQYLITTYDNNFKIMGEAIDNNGDILDAVRIVMLFLFMLCFIALIIAYILICILCSNRSKKVQHYETIESAPLTSSSIPLRQFQHPTV